MTKRSPRLLALALLVAAPALAQPLVVRQAGGSKSVTFEKSGTTLSVTLPSGEKLVGEAAGEKRLYRRGAGGAPVLEVKPGDAGFKVRTPDGKLLFKVKIADDKIKVSDNEENRNPWELKTKSDDKVKVVDASGREIVEVKFSADKTKVKDAAGRELWVCATPKRTAAFGVLALDAIPEEPRAIVAVEILSRGR